MEEITRILSPTATENSKYLTIDLPDESIVRIGEGIKKHKIIENTINVLSDDFVALVHDIRNRDRLLEFSAMEYEEWKVGTRDSLHITVKYKPEILARYKSVTISAANITKSELYSFWSELVDFQPHELTKKLRPELYETKGHLVSIRYISSRHGSKRQLETIGYERVLAATAKAFRAEFGNSQHIVCARKGYTWELDTGIQLPSNIKGVDNYKDAHMALHLSPVNPHPAYNNFLKDRHGKTNEEVKEAIPYESNYQFLTRTSYRDLNSSDPVTFIVLDRNIALYLQKMFQCPEPQPFNIGIPELWEDKKVAKTPTERKRIQRERDKEKAKKSLGSYDGLKINFWQSKESQEFSQVTHDWISLGDYIETNSELDNGDKLNLPMFREGDMLNLNNHKVSDNILSTKILVLDLDKPEGTPEVLSSYLKTMNYSHYLSASSSYDPDNRILNHRIVVGLDRAVDAGEYHNIMNVLQNDLNQHFRKRGLSSGL
ncbi:hypothetical protein GCM10007874_58640 [Labrys miyagiensis]|uniref:Uncharacterized protein n=2 Tax=Labrys miyagiensis TaxID=346912 RepID=A0ABQ6CVV9_9HYPH|nr:hypothetical protein GCM10007874_58640 [Labrys miyagiensis]